MKKKTLISLMIVFSCLCLFLFEIFYREAKNNTVKNLNEEQLILAKQAARGIEDYFATWNGILTAFSQIDDIINLNDEGRNLMKIFFEVYQDQINGITRMNEKGIIINTYPSDTSIGKDISGQKHVQEILRDHKPVASEVFMSVEGIMAVAIHVPLFRNGEFIGSIAVLVDFEAITKRYLEIIKIGETGYGWVISREGVILFTPIPGFVGKNAFEVTKNFPSLVALEKEMVLGHQGSGKYSYDRIADQQGKNVTKYAVYLPIYYGNTFWSIGVTSAEQDVLSSLYAFRNKLVLIIGLLFISGMTIMLILLVRAMTSIARQKVTEKDLRINRDYLQEMVDQRTIELTNINQQLVIENAERKQVELELLKAKERAEESDRLKSAFLANMSHEIRTPMNGILGFAELLKEPELTGEEQEKYISMIEKGGARMLSIIHDIISISKIESGQTEICPTEISLNTKFEDIYNFFLPEVRAKEPRLIFQTVLPESDVIIKSDKEKINSILTNLVKNAIKFTYKGSIIFGYTLEPLETNHDLCVRFFVKDTGIGIPKERQVAVFERFIQADAFHKLAAQGTGLGLSISKAYVEMLGGKIWVESEPGEGSVFYFTIPFQQVN